MQQLAGRVAVITGGASGIGLGMATRFAAEGMKLVLADIERPVLERVVAEFTAAGVEAIGVPTDVSLLPQVEALAAAAIERFGGVHVLCNNAGVGSRGLPVSNLPLRDYEWVFGVNLWGVIHGLHVFLPHLRVQDEAHIVNTASVAALYHLPQMAPYNATKAAVLAISETLKFELDAEGMPIGVSVLCPSWVRTNISTAFRNLPERLAYELTTEQVAEQTAYKARRQQQKSSDDALEPSDVADQVVAAIRDNRFYVITHPGIRDNIEGRFDRILAGDNPQVPRQ